MAKELKEAEFTRQLRAARARTKLIMKQAWWPIQAEYDQQRDAVLVTMRSGYILLIPRNQLCELKNLEPKELSKVEVVGEALRWDAQDIDVSFPGLFLEVFGTNMLTTLTGQRGGKSKSKVKATAARANGAKGGRPRKAG